MTDATNAPKVESGTRIFIPYEETPNLSNVPNSTDGTSATPSNPAVTGAPTFSGSGDMAPSPYFKR